MYGQTEAPEITDKKDRMNESMNRSMNKSMNKSYNSINSQEDEDIEDEEDKLMDELVVKRQLHDIILQKSEQVYLNLRALIFKSKH